MALLSASPPKWTRRFLLLCGVSLVVGLVTVLAHPLFGDQSALGGILFILAILSSWAFLAGLIGAVISYFREKKGQHGPPATPLT